MGVVKRIKCGFVNCFLIKENDNAILIDTGITKYKDKVLDICKNENVRLIVLTHGHIDHIQNTAYLAKKLNVPIAMNEDDYELTKDNFIEHMYAHSLLGKFILLMSLRSFKRDKAEEFKPDIFLKDGDSLEKFEVNAKVVSLKGHTRGSIGINAFGTDFIIGDALMNMFYPTKSMLYGNRKDVDNSACKISNLGNITIHFGHGKSVKNRKW